MNIEIKALKNNKGNVTRVLFYGMSYNFACEVFDNVVNINHDDLKINYLNGEVFFKDRAVNKTIAHYNEAFGTMCIKSTYIDKENFNKYIKRY